MTRAAARRATLAALVAVSWAAPAVVHAADPVAAHPTALDQINALVKTLEKKVGSGQLPSVEIGYGVRGDIEGVPPSMKCFFDDQTHTLVACRVHVGHETWSVEFDYYFDSSGVPLKYRETVTNREDKPAPKAILYGPKGEVLWKNTDKPRVDPKQILELYKSTTKHLEEFAPY